jgi:hypothetical protein
MSICNPLRQTNDGLPVLNLIWTNQLKNKREKKKKMGFRLTS